MSQKLLRHKDSGMHHAAARLPQFSSAGMVWLAIMPASAPARYMEDCHSWSTCAPAQPNLCSGHQGCSLIAPCFDSETWGSIVLESSSWPPRRQHHSCTWLLNWQ